MRKKQRKTKKEKKDENFLLSWTAGGTYSIDLDIYGAHSPLFIRFRVFPLKKERETPSSSSSCSGTRDKLRGPQGEAKKNFKIRTGGNNFFTRPTDRPDPTDKKKKTFERCPAASGRFIFV
jgi:hypothetical protein